MRKALAILLIITLSFEIAASAAFLKLRQNQIRAEMKSRLEKFESESDLVAITIADSLERRPNAVFRRFRADEFKYRGKMFDVVREKKVQGATIYYCVEDEKETKLLANFETDLARRSSKDKTCRTLREILKKSLEKIFKKENKFTDFAYVANYQRDGYIEQIYLSIVLGLEPPPPKSRKKYRQ